MVDSNKCCGKGKHTKGVSKTSLRKCYPLAAPGGGCPGVCYIIVLLFSHITYFIYIEIFLADTKDKKMMRTLNYEAS
jgi:hypothetical protein